MYKVNAHRVLGVVSKLELHAFYKICTFSEKHRMANKIEGFIEHSSER